jgi:PleD family two-component response regulator
MGLQLVNTLSEQLEGNLNYITAGNAVRVDVYAEPKGKRLIKMSVGKLLIVEDERIVAKDIQSTLQNLGYEILAMVSSGEEAVSRAAEMRPTWC